MNVRLLGLALGLGLALPVVAQAQMLQPGLWEMTSSNVKVDDQPMDVQSILGQLQGQMTPQQRAALEKNGWTPAWMAGDEFANFVDAEFASMRATMAKSGMI